MLNKDVNVPENTIAIFNHMQSLRSNPERINLLISEADKKRDWFTPHFYKCLPLVIGNQYGFIIKSEYDFSFEWNGTDDLDAVTIYSENNENLFPKISSHFGSGIMTINLPFVLRTPPGINLMTINPPNFIIPNATVMTGVVEADNLRHDFTINLRVHTPNVKTFIPKGTPIGAILPIPRYFVDNFKLEIAEDIFDERTIEEESFAQMHFSEFKRTFNTGINKHYRLGTDVYGNEFSDHQTKLNKNNTTISPLDT